MVVRAGRTSFEVFAGGAGKNRGSTGATSAFLRNSIRALASPRSFLAMTCMESRMHADTSSAMLLYVP